MASRKGSFMRHFASKRPRQVKVQKSYRERPKTPEDRKEVEKLIREYTKAFNRFYEKRWKHLEEENQLLQKYVDGKFSEKEVKRFDNYLRDRDYKEARGYRTQEKDALFPYRAKLGSTVTKNIEDLMLEKYGENKRVLSILTRNKELNMKVLDKKNELRDIRMHKNREKFDRYLKWYKEKGFGPIPKYSKENWKLRLYDSSSTLRKRLKAGEITKEAAKKEIDALIEKSREDMGLENRLFRQFEDMEKGIQEGRGYASVENAPNLSQILKMDEDVVKGPERDYAQSILDVLKNSEKELVYTLPLIDVREKELEQIRKHMKTLDPKGTAYMSSKMFADNIEMQIARLKGQLKKGRDDYLKKYMDARKKAIKELGEDKVRKFEESGDEIWKGINPSQQDKFFQFDKASRDPAHGEEGTHIGARSTEEEKALRNRDRERVGEIEEARLKIKDLRDRIRSMEEMETGKPIIRWPHDKSQKRVEEGI